MKVFKKLTSLFLATLLALSALVAVPFTASAETPTLTAVTPTPDWGTANSTEKTISDDGNTYYINSINDLQAFADQCKANGNGWGGNTGAANGNSNFPGKNIVLTADLDMAGMLWESANVDFGGHFDGQGHTIYNFTAVRTSGNYGFFDYVRNGGSVKNVSFVNAYLETVRAFSAIIARATAETATFENVYLDGVIHTTTSGYNATNPKTAERSIGGFVGQVAGGTTNFDKCVSNLTYSCIVGGTQEEPTYTNCPVGGFVGVPNVAATINFTDCAFIGDISLAGLYSAGFVCDPSTCKATVNLTRSVCSGTLSGLTTACPAFVYLNGSSAITVTLIDCYTVDTKKYPVLVRGSVTGSTVSVTFTKGTADTTDDIVANSPGIVENETTLVGTDGVEQKALRELFNTNTTLGDPETLAHSTIDFTAAKCAPLVQNGWVATDDTVNCRADKTVTLILPSKTIASFMTPVTPEYWQTNQDGSSLRFVSSVNFSDLSKYDKVGFEVTVKVKDAQGNLVTDEKISSNTVYTQITADGATKKASELGATYLSALSINGFKAGVTYEITLTAIVEKGETTVIHDYAGAITGTYTTTGGFVVD